MRFYLIAVTLGLGAGVWLHNGGVLFAEQEVGATGAVKAAAWARSPSPFSAPDPEPPLILRASSALRVWPARTVVNETHETGVLGPIDPTSAFDLTLRMDARSPCAEPGAADCSSGGPVAVSGPGKAADAAPRSAGELLVQSLTEQAPGAGSAARGEGQDTREPERPALGPQDLALAFYPGSVLQPERSVRSRDGEATVATVTMASNAPFEQVASFYRDQFLVSSQDLRQVHEVRAAAGEWVFSDADEARGQRWAFVRQSGSTVTITLVRNSTDTDL